MTNKITDAATIRSFIEKGVRVCPEGVDENTFNVLLAAYAPAEIEDNIRIMENIVRFLCVRQDEA